MTWIDFRKAISDAQEGRQTPDAVLAVSGVENAPERAAAGFATWAEFIEARPAGGAVFNQWLLDSVEALMRRVAALEAEVRASEGGK